MAQCLQGRTFKYLKHTLDKETNGSSRFINSFQTLLQIYRQ